MGLFFESTLTEVFIFIILYLVYRYSKKDLDYWENLGVKHNKPLPFLGNSAHYFIPKKCFALFHKDLYDQFPKERFVGYYDFLSPTLLLKDPDTIRSVIIKDSLYFYDRVTHMDGELNPLDNHLAFLKGQQWKIIRSKLSTVFTSRKLKIMYEQFVECVDELSKMLDKAVANHDKPEVEVNRSMKQLSLDITGSCAFGLRLDCLKDPNSEFVKKSNNVFSFSLRLLISLMLKSMHHNLPKVLNFKERSKEVEDFFINFIKDSLHTREEKNIRRNDFLQLMIDLRKEDFNELKSKYNGQAGEEQNSKTQISLMDDVVFASNIFIFLNAGTDTIGSAITFCLLELAINSNIQDRLYQEIKQTLHMKGDNVSYYDIKNLTYLDWVTSETLRKYPVGGSFPRVCTKTYKIPNTDVVLKEGVQIFVSSYALHHDPEYYPEPEKFVPERFSEEAKNARPHCTYLPFGDGPRHCIAMRFALIVIKVALFKLISQFEFRKCQKTKYPVEFEKSSMMVICGHDVWLNVYKRNK